MKKSIIFAFILFSVTSLHSAQAQFTIDNITSGGILNGPEDTPTETNVINYTVDPTEYGYDENTNTASNILDTDTEIDPFSDDKVLLPDIISGENQASDIFDAEKAQYSNSNFDNSRVRTLPAKNNYDLPKYDLKTYYDKAGNGTNIVYKSGGNLSYNMETGAISGEKVTSGLLQGSKFIRPQLDQGISESRSIRELFIGWIRWAMVLVGVLCVVGGIYAGFLQITAAANEENIVRSRKIYMYITLGVMTIFGSYSLTRLITTGGVYEAPIPDDISIAGYAEQMGFEVGEGQLDIEIPQTIQNIIQNPLAEVVDLISEPGDGTQLLTDVNARYCDQCGGDMCDLLGRPIMLQQGYVTPYGYMFAYCNPNVTSTQEAITDPLEMIGYVNDVLDTYIESTIGIEIDPRCREYAVTSQDVQYLDDPYFSAQTFTYQSQNIFWGPRSVDLFMNQYLNDYPCN